MLLNGNKAGKAARAPRNAPSAWAASAEERGRVTHQLPLRDVLLPPEVRTHGGDRRQTIVGVHQDMDEAVQRGTKISCRNRGDVVRRMHQCLIHST